MEQVARKNRLKELRMKALLNQKELSSRSGVSPWTISKIEHGLRMPQVSVAHQLAQALGATIEDIFFPDDISILHISKGQQGKGGR